jgi:hypothetical protein
MTRAFAQELVIARSEATKQSMPQRLRNDGLLRFARNDEGVKLHSRGAILRPSLAIRRPSRKQRAQGMPGARRTHCLASKTKKTLAGQHRYAEITPALPAQWFYGCSVIFLVCRAF